MSSSEAFQSTQTPVELSPMEFPATSSGTVQQIPSQNGQLLVHSDFPSRFVNPRNVNVWLPPGYSKRGDARYPVIYAHDGQNLFDPATAYGGVDWGLGEALNRLAAEGVWPAMVVGVWNTPDRWREYNPQRVFEKWLSPEEQEACAEKHGLPLSDLYLRFIAEELKPFIDAQYRTRRERQSTFIMGSSMGGLVSAYAMCEYPEVFGAAACLSTHWPACRGKMADYLREHAPDPGTHRFYFDYGTQTLDAQYEPYQLQVDDVLLNTGFTEEATLLARKFAGDDHSERAWLRRVDIPLRFLLADR